MKNFFYSVILIICFVFNFEYLFASSIYFNKGKNLFENEKFDEAKFNFEKDIVFNPKNELSYLYLAKIFKIEEKSDLEENNLNTVILLNPKNEDAVYNLVLLNIKQSNFKKAEELMKTLEIICKQLCSSKKALRKSLSDASK